MGTPGASSNGHRRQSGALEEARLESLAVHVRRGDDVAIVQPRGALDIATAGTLRTALEGIEHPGRLVLDLRGLSFIDSTGLHLLVALHQRAQRDAFQLMLVAPIAPVDRAIRLCALDEALPFVEAGEAIHDEPGESKTEHVTAERRE